MSATQLSHPTDLNQSLIRVQLGRDAGSLRAAAMQLITVDEVWVASAAVVAYAEGAELRVTTTTERRVPDGVQYVKHSRPGVPRPADIAILKRSPMLVDIGFVNLSAMTVSVTAVSGVFLYFLRNPDKLGSFLGDAVSAWHRSWGDVEEAKRRRHLESLLNRELGVGSRRVGVKKAQGVRAPGADPARQLEALGDRLEALEPTVVHTEGVEEVGPSNLLG